MARAGIIKDVASYATTNKPFNCWDGECPVTTITETDYRTTRESWINACTSVNNSFLRSKDKVHGECASAFDRHTAGITLGRITDNYDKESTAFNLAFAQSDNTIYYIVLVILVGIILHHFL